MNLLMGLAAAALLVALPALAADQGELAPAGEQVAIDDGHIDMGPLYVDGVWEIRIKDDTGTAPVWRPLPDVVLVANDASIIEIPETGFEFLGSAGAAVHLLPQAQQAGVLWPGWNTQHPSVADTIRRSITWTLHGIDGPGDMVLFLAGSFGEPEIIFDSKGALPQSVSIAMGTHVHGNWVFTEPGLYSLDIEMSGTTNENVEESARDTLTFAVGDETTPEWLQSQEPPAVATSTTVAPDTTSTSEATAPDATGPSAWPWIAGGAAVLLMAGVAMARRRVR